MSYVAIFLVIYFILFFGLAVIWRNWLVYKKTGINAYKLKNKAGPESITNFYFRILPLLSILVLIVYIVFPTYYFNLGAFHWMTNQLMQGAGVGLMCVGLLFVIMAQAQMGASWRIGIDHDMDTKLVINGIYRYSRNPIFMGVIVISLGYFLILPNAITLVILALDIVLIQIQVALEEEFLLSKHGEKYKEFCCRVSRWL